MATISIAVAACPASRLRAGEIWKVHRRAPYAA